LPWQFDAAEIAQNRRRAVTQLYEARGRAMEMRRRFDRLDDFDGDSWERRRR
jgi:hypothetical protein